MRYLIRTLVGFSLIVASLAAIGYAIYQLLQIGTCATGGPYVSARQCPAGTERLGLMIPAVLLALFAGAIVYAGRGKAPGSDRAPANEWLAVWVWTGLFWSIAAGCFLGVWGPDAHPGPGGKEGGLIVGFLFIPLGLLGFAAVKIPFPWTQGKPAGAAARMLGSERLARAAVTRMPGSDPVAKLERLAKLRDQGAITGAEFERLKAQVMGGG
jgi:hypothetical protein